MCLCCFPLCVAWLLSDTLTLRTAAPRIPVWFHHVILQKGSQLKEVRMLCPSFVQPAAFNQACTNFFFNLAGQWVWRTHVVWDCKSFFSCDCHASSTFLLCPNTSLPQIMFKHFFNYTITRRGGWKSSASHKNMAREIMEWKVCFGKASATTY